MVTMPVVAVDEALAAVLPFDLLSVTTNEMLRFLPATVVTKLAGFFSSALKYRTFPTAVARALYATAVPVDGSNVNVQVAADHVPVSSAGEA
jgi:hypothetical protein